MKRARSILLGTGLISILAASLMIGMIGCAGGGCAAGKGQLNPTTGVYDTNAMASTLVVTVESIREIALSTFATLFKVEREHEAELKALNPGIHEFTEKLRRDGQKSLDSLTKAKTEYQRTRSEADATALKETLAAVQSLLKDAVKYLGESAARKGTP